MSGSFELIVKAVLNEVIDWGWNATSAVQLSPAPIAGDASPQGFDPPLKFKVKFSVSDKERLETSNVASPLFRISTSKGAGVLPGVTGPKSYDGGKTCREGLGGTTGELLEPPPHAKNAAATAKGRIIRDANVFSPIMESSRHASILC